MLNFALQRLIDNQLATKDGVAKSIQLNYFEAKRATQIQLKTCKENGLELPHSRLVFHLQELITTICMSSNAALDHSELYNVQESSIFVLAKLIKCFSKMDDPEVADTKLLEQYAQQIFSSV